MDLVIINYGAGNIQSIRFAFERLGFSPELSADPDRISRADKIIFPGVGEASSAMAKLKQSGLDRLIPELKQPVLGICLGMQLMCRRSEEGGTPGLGIFDVDVVRFTGVPKVPQIGWNSIRNLASPLFQGVGEDEYIYLVHSYFAPLGAQTIATSEYGGPYSAALAEGNFFGVQFHPEKSGKTGARILKNFLEI
ncbi:imidazole glycerol phosphate synthase subunit HisH [Robiginitalea marina]|uniref:Imidazole glycerol phosphate synthase subunit HisH n=1 Tax=Robiginitalea marina TaxID=2954105 RepID=A0ABT1AUK8_9FLAO|nr:imidazole glycerol phosphate synthase subunit HisH [Robiginitalea marina]MCO5723566.1 imidazole glycerol phosphate synthase subunit HisH [Robiginitalea marina]